MNIKLTVSSAIAFLAGLGTSTVFINEAGTAITVTPDIPYAESVLVRGATRAEIATAMADAETTRVRCTHGVIDNHPKRHYCTDGGTVGFLLDEQVVDDLDVGDGAFELWRDAENKVYIQKVTP